MKLTATTIKNSKPKNKTYTLSDGKGLFLEITTEGSKRWRFRYNFNNKAKKISLGLYPEVGLKDAREKQHEYRTMITKGINPSKVRKTEKESRSEANTFTAVATEWFEKNKHRWTKEYAHQIYRRLEKNIFPYIGETPISEITSKELLLQLRRIEERGAIDMAHRVKGSCSEIFLYAVATSRATRDITYDFKRALTPAKEKHYACITDPIKIGGLLRSIDSYQGYAVTQCALKLAPLTFVRPGELRQAEWAEINWNAKTWCIPAEKMKAKKVHIVPLSRQSIEILKFIKQLTGKGKYVFPSIRSSTRPLSGNAVLGALRRMDYTKDEMTGHGFRAMASTLLNEQGYKWDVIERQLAHTEQNNVRAAYNHAEYIEERTTMMQEWADYLDGLRTGNVTTITRKAS